jgi:head-tail adaptor
MTAPRLSRRLVLEAAVRTPDGAGGFATQWTALGTLWADLAPRAARLSAQPGGQEARQPLRVTVRGAPPGAPSRPQPGQRFRIGDATFAIVSVAPADPQGRFLHCLAHEETTL